METQSAAWMWLHDSQLQDGCCQHRGGAESTQQSLLKLKLFFFFFLQLFVSFSLNPLDSRMETRSACTGICFIFPTVCSVIGSRQPAHFTALRLHCKLLCGTQTHGPPPARGLVSKPKSTQWEQPPTAQRAALFLHTGAFRRTGPVGKDIHWSSVFNPPSTSLCSIPFPSCPHITPLRPSAPAYSV